MKVKAGFQGEDGLDAPVRNHRQKGLSGPRCQLVQQREARPNPLKGMLYGDASFREDHDRLAEEPKVIPRHETSLHPHNGLYALNGSGLPAGPGRYLWGGIDRLRFCGNRSVCGNFLLGGGHSKGEACVTRRDGVAFGLVLNEELCPLTASADKPIALQGFWWGHIVECDTTPLQFAPRGLVSRMFADAISSRGGSRWFQRTLRCCKDQLRWGLIPARILL